MLSSQQHPPAKIAILAFDADGCLYNFRKYTRVLVKIVDQYWDFFEKFYNKKGFTPAEEAEVQAKIAEITAYVANLNFEELSGLPIVSIMDIQSEKLKKNIETKKAILKQFGEDRLDETDTDEFKILRFMVGKFIPFLKKFNPQILEMIFLKANQKLFEQVAANLKAENVAGYETAFETNRQSLVHDNNGMEQNGTDSIHLDYYHLLSALRSLMPDVIARLNPFTLSDVNANPEAQSQGFFMRGNAHHKIVKEQNKIAHFNDHKPAIYDLSKLTVIYGIAHDSVVHAAKELNIKAEQIEYTLDVFDNEMRILDQLKKTLETYPQLLPRGLKLRLFHYDGILKSEPMAIIPGTGELDKNYAENIRKMVSMCGHDFKDIDKPINAALNLNIEQFLKERELEVKLPKAGRLFAQENQQALKKTKTVEEKSVPDLR